MFDTLSTSVNFEKVRNVAATSDVGPSSNFDLTSIFRKRPVFIHVVKSTETKQSYATSSLIMDDVVGAVSAIDPQKLQFDRELADKWNYGEDEAESDDADDDSMASDDEVKMNQTPPRDFIFKSAKEQMQLLSDDFVKSRIADHGAKTTMDVKQLKVQFDEKFQLSKRNIVIVSTHLKLATGEAMPRFTTGKLNDNEVKLVHKHRVEIWPFSMENCLAMIPVLLFDGAVKILDRPEWRCVLKRWLSVEKTSKLKHFYTNHLCLPPIRWQEVIQIHTWRIIESVIETQKRMYFDEDDEKAMSLLQRQHNRYIDEKYERAVLIRDEDEPVAKSKSTRMSNIPAVKGSTHN